MDEKVSIKRKSTHSSFIVDNLFEELELFIWCIISIFKILSLLLQLRMGDNSK